jgi:hypothetical protein
MPKPSSNAKDSGRRNVGRPRARWLDQVNKGERKLAKRKW